MRKFGELWLALLLLCVIPVAAQETIPADRAAEWTPVADSAAGQFSVAEQASADGRFSATEFSMLVKWSPGDASAAPHIRQESCSRQIKSGQAPDLRPAGSVRYLPRRFDPRHELRWTFGFAPLNSNWDEANWNDQDLSNPAYEVLHSKYSNSFFGRFSLGALSVQYAYRLTGRWEISASLTYSRFGDRLHPAPEGLETKKLREHYLTLMPGIRCSWIRNRRFRLYSALEAGGQFAIRRGFFDDDYRTEFRGIGQFTLAGITVGRNFFFCTELGVGSRGVVLVGMGWRFDSKNTKR